MRPNQHGSADPELSAMPLHDSCMLLDVRNMSDLTGYGSCPTSDLSCPKCTSTEYVSLSPEGQSANSGGRERICRRPVCIWRDTNVKVYEYSVHVTWHSAFSEGGRAYLIGMHGRIALRGGDTTST